MFFAPRRPRSQQRLRRHISELSSQGFLNDSQMRYWTEFLDKQEETDWRATGGEAAAFACWCKFALTVT